MTDNLKVFCSMEDQRYFVGRLRQYEKRIFFEYDADFLSTGLELSPFKLPLRPGVFEDKDYTFKGLYGLFNDSLPDGWGLLLLDRILRKQGLKEISPFNRLTLVADQGMGALEYLTEKEPKNKKIKNILNLDGLADESRRLLHDEDLPLETINKLFRFGGSSGGARPKILVDVSEDKTKICPSRSGDTRYSPWIIKFHAKDEAPDTGLKEFVYSVIARKAGVEISDTFLFPSETTPGFFGTKRFDRRKKQKIHVHTACGLLHADHRHSSLDYENLLKLTKILTKNISDVKKMVRLMVFNVKARNLDDHSKNFSFLLDSENQWKLAPAYDLTLSTGFHGEHNAMVNGKGKNISDADLIAAAAKVDIPASYVREIIQITEAELAHYPEIYDENFRPVKGGR